MACNYFVDKNGVVGVVGVNLVAALSLKLNWIEIFYLVKWKVDDEDCWVMVNLKYFPCWLHGNLLWLSIDAHHSNRLE